MLRHWNRCVDFLYLNLAISRLIWRHVQRTGADTVVVVVVAAAAVVVVVGGGGGGGGEGRRRRKGAGAA